MNYLTKSLSENGNLASDKEKASSKFFRLSIYTLFDLSNLIESN